MGIFAARLRALLYPEESDFLSSAQALLDSHAESILAVIELAERHLCTRDMIATATGKPLGPCAMCRALDRLNGREG